MKSFRMTIDAEFETEEDLANFSRSLGNIVTRADTPADTTKPAARTTSKPAETNTEDTNRSASDEDAALEEEISNAGVDVDGMAFDRELHAIPPQKNKDETWRAARGKADEANAARDAWKARGGDVKKPETDDVGLPGQAREETTETGLPGADKVPTRGPVDMPTVVAAAKRVMEAGKIDNDGIRALYAEVTGNPDTSEAMKLFNTNETLRAALLDKLVALETK